MSYTTGFANMSRFIDHFTRHAPLLGLATPAEYEAEADEFLGNPVLPAGVLQCFRSNGDKIRYNPNTEEWGVLSSANVIKTYYILTSALAKHGNGTNYFNSECAK